MSKENKVIQTTEAKLLAKVNEEVDKKVAIQTEETNKKLAETEKVNADLTATNAEVEKKLTEAYQKIASLEAKGSKVKQEEKVFSNPLMEANRNLAAAAQEIVSGAVTALANAKEDEIGEVVWDKGLDQIFPGGAEFSINLVDYTFGPNHICRVTFNKLLEAEKKIANGDEYKLAQGKKRLAAALRGKTYYLKAHEVDVLAFLGKGPNALAREKIVDPNNFQQSNIKVDDEIHNKVQSIDTSSREAYLRSIEQLSK